jgi:STE24 endopeptidase
MTMMMAAAAAAQGGFDPEAATRAYLTTLQGAARARSDAYFEGGYWLPLWGALVSIAVAWLTLRLGWSAGWRRRAEEITKRRWLQPAIYAVPFVVVTTVIALPWGLYAHYFREKQYGLMNLSLVGWLRQQAISLALGIVMTAILLTIIFAVIRKAPRSWWLWGAGAMSLFVAFGILIAPVFIAPLFNHYQPMPPGPMRDQILEMAQTHRIPADNVYVFDASKQSKRISANVSGLGPTIRISLNDNLLNRSTPAEIKAVMGHEMGHYVLGHIWRMVIILTAIFLVAAFLLWWLTPRILARWGSGWGVRNPADPAVTPLFAALLAVFFLVLTPLLNTVSRVDESEADAFGLEAAREPDGFASVAMKLSEYRKIEPTPLEEAIFYDHPSGRTRVHMSMMWKAAHLRELAARQPAPVEVPLPKK